MEEDAPLNNPHDAFIKSSLGTPERMASFLQAYLPSALAASVDWSSLQPAEKAFLDEQLHERHADLIFTARFRGKPLFFHLLFEHQKTVDPWMPLRLLTYQVRIWEVFRKNKPKAKRLPPVLPIVFFQDRGQWAPSPHFHDLLDLPEDLDPQWLDHLPDFKHVILNLSELELDAINQDLVLRVMIEVLRSIFAPDSEASFITAHDALQALKDSPDHLAFFRTCMTYLFRAENTLDRRTVYAIIATSKSPKLREEAMTIAEQLIQEGRQEGERLLLQRQITRKFGGLDFLTQEKVNHASEADLVFSLLNSRIYFRVFFGRRGFSSTGTVPRARCMF
jgi:predicted transposase/invertase (TIGR01784 family)